MRTSTKAKWQRKKTRTTKGPPSQTNPPQQHLAGDLRPMLPTVKLTGSIKESRGLPVDSKDCGLRVPKGSQMNELPG